MMSAAAGYASVATLPSLLLGDATTREQCIFRSTYQWIDAAFPPLLLYRQISRQAQFRVSLSACLACGACRYVRTYRYMLADSRADRESCLPLHCSRLHRHPSSTSRAGRPTAIRHLEARCGRPPGRSNPRHRNQDARRPELDLPGSRLDARSSYPCSVDNDSAHAGDGGGVAHPPAAYPCPTACRKGAPRASFCEPRPPNSCPRPPAGPPALCCSNSSACRAEFNALSILLLLLYLQSCP